MARKTVVELIDDLDGGKADQTVQLAHAGQWYELDLSQEHAAQLREDLARWVAAARKISPAGAPARRQVPTAVPNATVRAWAASHGMNVPSRGRIPNRVVQAYQAANS